MKAVPIWYNYERESEIKEIKDRYGELPENKINELVDSEKWIEGDNPIYFKLKDIQFFHIDDSQRFIRLKFYNDSLDLNIKYSDEIYNKLIEHFES